MFLKACFLQLSIVLYVKHLFFQYYAHEVTMSLSFFWCMIRFNKNIRPYISYAFQNFINIVFSDQYPPQEILLVKFSTPVS